MSGNNGFTSIPVYPSTRDRVSTLKRPGESWSDTLDRLVDETRQDNPDV